MSRAGSRIIRRLVGAALMAAIGSPPIAAAVRDDALQRGARQVERGAYAEAAATLEGVVIEAEHESKPEDAPRLAEALLYLGAAHAGLGDDTSARVRFRRALALVPGLGIASRKLPRRAVRLFEEVKAEAPSAGPARARGGGGASTIAALAVAGGGAAAAAAALTMKAETDSMPTPTPTLPPLPKTEAFKGTLVVGEELSTSVNVGPGGAGPWRADLAWSPGGVVLEAVVFSGQTVIARGAPAGPASARAEWTGTVGAVYRVDIVLAQPGNAKSVDWELKATYP